MAVLTLPAVAKLNLFLHIIGRRADGYHCLETLFQFVDYGDSLSFTPTREHMIRFSCSAPQLATDANLVMRAAQLLQQQFPEQWQGVHIHLDKRLPAGGGLGGGSSDAATTLLALCQLWQLPLTTEQLATLGLRLGADVPVFIHGRAAFATGIGEQLTPAEPPCPWYLVVHPGVTVATPVIFQHPELPRNHPPLVDWTQWQWENTSNDCESLVRQLYPEVANALDWLVEYAPPRLTGTGACVFARFNSEAQAQQVLQALPSRWHGFVAQGLNVNPVCQHLRQASTVNLPD